MVTRSMAGIMKKKVLVAEVGEVEPSGAKQALASAIRKLLCRRSLMHLQWTNTGSLVP